MFETKIFRNFISFRFDAKLLWFGLISFQINFLSEEFGFVLKFKQLPLVMRSKSNHETFDSSLVTNMLHTRAALNLPSGHLPASHQYLKEDNDTDECRWKSFEIF